MIIDQIVEEIKKAKTIIVLTHENPDGDAIGSSLALYLSLKQLGKKVDVIIQQIPRTYRFLPGINEVKEKSDEETYDVAIALDSGDIKRLNGFSNYFEDAKVKISIDHHISNTMFADLNYVNHTAPATAQILITILEYLEVEITKEIGTCLCTGIITDTGGFKYPNTTRETFEFIAVLLSKGINISSIYRQVFDIISIGQFNLTNRALNRMEFIENNKIAYTYITDKDVQETGTGIGEHEGIVNYGLSVEGVEVSVFIREDKNEYKVSLRSASYVNVSDICLLFNGGGHFNAAGCTISLPIEQAKQRIINEIKKALK